MIRAKPGSSCFIAIAAALLFWPLVDAQAQVDRPGSSDGRYLNPIIFARAHLDEKTGRPIRSGKIWIMEEDGSGLRQLTFGVVYDDHPALFSDGRHALYSEFRATSFDPDGGARLIQIDIYSGDRKVFAEETGCALHHVNLALPGDKLVYHHDCGDRKAQRVGWGPDSYEVNMWAANGVALGDGVIFMRGVPFFL